MVTAHVEILEYFLDIFLIRTKFLFINNEYELCTHNKQSNHFIFSLLILIS